MRKTFPVSVISALMISSILLSACSSSNEPTSSTAQPNVSESPKETAKAAEPVTLRYIRGSALSDNEKTYLELFHKQNPNITIQVEQAGGGIGDIMEKAAALQAAGTPGDITWVQNVLPWGKDDLLLDLTPYMKSDPVLSKAKIPADSLKALQFKGKQVAVPRAENPIIIFVNKDLLAKHGVDMPKNDWTWEDYREVAKKVTDPKAGEYGIAYGPFNSIITAGVLPVANGTSPNLYFMDKDWKQSLMGTPAGRSDIEWITDLQRVDHSIGTWDELTKAGADDGWLKGKTAFEIHGVWEGKNRRDKAKFNWDVLPLPKGKEKQIGYNVGTGIGVLAASKHPAEAVKFLSFMHTVEAQKLMMQNGDFPLTEDQELKQALLETPIWKGTNILASIGVEMRAEPVGSIVGSEEYVQWWSDDVQKAFKEGADQNKSLFNQAQHFNEVTLKLRKDLGLE
ncbi:sugar ABC transporter substrate-binding protein [Paenibacillus oryzisoli]|uniref:ABC transporter substrate-binding protein n=1 Tax=Paenibacillus oryzisoli TaxID=1850517 RepID=UPI003D283266